MLKQLLKYEFKATGRVYGGLYLAILAVAALMGSFCRAESMPEELIAVMLMIYLALAVAIVVVTLLTTIQRFTRNLLGREGYLMHTLPVTSGQLILSKLISSVTWILCGGPVVLLSFGLFCLLGTVNSAAVSELMKSLLNYWPEAEKLLGIVIENYGITLVLMAVEWLVSLNCSILCIYTACMIGHWCKKYAAPAGIAAFVVLNVVQDRLLSLLPYKSGNAALNLVFTPVNDGGLTYAVTGSRGTVWAVLAALAADLVLCGIYFAATSWMMKNKLNLE